MAGKPAKRFEDKVKGYKEARPSNPNLTSKATQRSVRNDNKGDFSIGIKDIDESIVFYFNNVIKKRSVCFILSDFMDNNFDKSLKIARKKHDIIALRIHDEREEQLVDVGLIKLEDTETGDLKWVDTSSKNIRKEFRKNYLIFEENLKKTLQHSAVDHINIKTGKDYVKPLINFFKNRRRK